MTSINPPSRYIRKIQLPASLITHPIKASKLPDNKFRYSLITAPYNIIIGDSVRHLIKNLPYPTQLIYHAAKEARATGRSDLLVKKPTPTQVQHLLNQGLRAKEISRHYKTRITVISKMIYQNNLEHLLPDDETILTPAVRDRVLSGEPFRSILSDLGVSYSTLSRRLSDAGYTVPSRATRASKLKMSQVFYGHLSPEVLRLPENDFQLLLSRFYASKKKDLASFLVSYATQPTAEKGEKIE